MIKKIFLIILIVGFTYPAHPMFWNSGLLRFAMDEKEYQALGFSETLDEFEAVLNIDEVLGIYYALEDIKAGNICFELPFYKESMREGFYKDLMLEKLQISIHYKTMRSCFDMDFLLNQRKAYNSFMLHYLKSKHDKIIISEIEQIAQDKLIAHFINTRPISKDLSIKFMNEYYEYEGICKEKICH